jgi:alpha/beta superfamily hydrolase
MPLLSRLEPVTVAEDALFSAGLYRLHGELSYPEEGRARAAVVVAGPHPFLGGNLRNNVVRTLTDGLAARGMLTLRFDYRGVGRSEGPAVDVVQHVAQFWRTSHVPDEIDFAQDLQGAVEFVRAAAPHLPLALVGYSFGCALLPAIQPQDDLYSLVLIAPTVAKHNYDSFRAVHTPLLVIASEDDFATDADQLEQWFNTLCMPRQLVRRHCDNHFFRRHEPWLVETICQFLDHHER